MDKPLDSSTVLNLRCDTLAETRRLANRRVVNYQIEHFCEPWKGAFHQIEHF